MTDEHTQAPTLEDQHGASWNEHNDHAGEDLDENDEHHAEPGTAGAEEDEDLPF